MMTRDFMSTAAICAFLAGWGGLALAEDRVAPLPKPSPESSAAIPAMRPMLAGKLIGTTVCDSLDQKLGSINDLLIAPDRRIEQFVVSVGGLLGVGDKLVALPVAAFSNGPDGLTLRGTTKESLKLLPDFNKTAFSEVSGGKSEASDATHIAPATLASVMIGASVRDAADQKIGAVDDMVIGPDRRIEQFVLSVGGFLGLGDKLVALPVSEFRSHREGLVLAGATQRSLEAAPAFDKAVFAAATPAAPRAAAGEPKSDMDRLRADYQAKMDEWGRKIGDYKDRAATNADEAKTRMREGLDTAWEKTKAEWSEFKGSTAETYQDAKNRLDRAIEDLSRRWQETTG